jgi:hypothetical protein
MCPQPAGAVLCVDKLVVMRGDYMVLSADFGILALGLSSGRPEVAWFQNRPEAIPALRVALPRSSIVLLVRTFVIMPARPPHEISTSY